MINYLSKFSPRLTELAKPIRELVEEKVPFNWCLEHQEAFTMLKKEIVRAPVLAYYNPQKETILQTHASKKGLGACLPQEKKPIYFASKALTETHRGYVAIKNWIPCCSLGSWKVPPFFIWLPLYTRNWPETTRSNPIQKSQSSNSKSAAHCDQNFTIQFYSKIYSGT